MSSSSSDDGVKLEDWIKVRELGSGTTGIVYLVKNKDTGKKAAMKVVHGKTKGMTDDEWQLLKTRTEREAKILKLLDHPNIVHLYEYYQKDDKFYLVMELVTGGELLDRVQDHPKARLPEENARKWFRQIVSAVDYCHSHYVVHRDLKLENVLIDSHDNIMITDFGFANMVEDFDVMLKTFCGSPMYAAPEIFIGVKYLGPPLDVWSMGVLLFTMVSGQFPWKSKTADYNLMKEVISGKFQIPNHLSDGVASLIKGMLQVDPRDRMTLSEVINHEWMVEGDLPKLSSASTNFLKLSTKDEIEQDALDELVAMGFSREAAVKAIVTDQNSIVYAAYQLLLKQRKKDQKSKKKKSSKHKKKPSSRKTSSSKSSSSSSTKSKKKKKSTKK